MRPVVVDLFSYSIYHFNELIFRIESLKAKVSAIESKLLFENWLTIPIFPIGKVI